MRSIYYICSFPQMANRNGSEDPVSLYATNGIATEATVKLAINDIVKNNPFLDDIDLAGVTDTTQLSYALAKKQSALLLILLLISKVTAFDASSLKAGYQHVLDSVQKRLANLQGATSSGAGMTPPGNPGPIKRPKKPEIPKFDINKPGGMQTFLNSMELLSQSFTFANDKELADFYLNNLTETSKTIIFSIYPQMTDPFYQSSTAVISYLQSFVSQNVKIHALKAIRSLTMGENGLFTYYQSFNRLVSELGPNALAIDTQVHYFIEGLNSNSVRNTNLNLHMLKFYETKPNATVTDLYTEADKVISLSADTRKGNSNGRPNDHNSGYRRDRQRSPPPRPNGKSNGRSQSRGGGGSKRQRPNVTCSKCQRNHETKDCVASWSKSGVFLGKGTPPANHFWSKQNDKQASDSLKFKDKQKQAITAALTNRQPVRQRLHPQPAKDTKGKGKLPTRFAKALLIQTSETSDLNNISPLQDSDVVMEEDSFTSAIDNTEPQWKSVHEDESELESDSEEEVEVKRRTVQSLNKQVPEPSAQARGTRCNKPLTPYQHDLHTKAYYKQKKKVHFKTNRG